MLPLYLTEKQVWKDFCPVGSVVLCRVHARMSIHCYLLVIHLLILPRGEPLRGFHGPR